MRCIIFLLCWDTIHWLPGGILSLKVTCVFAFQTQEFFSHRFVSLVQFPGSSSTAYVNDATFELVVGTWVPRRLCLLISSGWIPLPSPCAMDRGSLSWFALSFSLCALSSSLFKLLRSGYASSVCWDRVIDDGLLVDWAASPTGGLAGSGNSPAPYSVLLLKPGFLAKSNPLTPPSTFQDNNLICS